MGLRGFHRVFEDLRARRGNGSGPRGRSAIEVAPGPNTSRLPPHAEPGVDRRRAFGFAAVVGVIAFGVGGYAIGVSQAVDVDAAEQAGTVAGEQRGTAAGAREGYASAFKPARERGFDAAYREAYRTAYLEEFERADLEPPSRVPVPEP